MNQRILQVALRHTLICLLAVASITLGGCQDLSGIKGDIDDLKDKVSDLQLSIDRLWQAYDAGKLITSVETAAAVGPKGGYLITFSDGTTLTLYNGADGQDGANGADGQDGQNGQNGQDGQNGQNGTNGEDGVTPMLKIDEDGYWCVSYDGGVTYDRMTDADGNPIFSRGADGQDGQNGQNGQNGAPGICVRVVIDADGYYTFELYAPDAPDEVIETIHTPYTSDRSNIMQSIVEDDLTGVITLTLADGTELRFNLDVTYPTSIVVLTNKVEISPGARATFDFRINPSNARFVPVVSGDAANLHLDMVGSRAASSYVTDPSNYRLVSVEHAVNADGDIKQGQYTVTVEESEAAPYTYSENVVLVLTTRDGRGEQIQLSSSLVEFSSSPIPKLLSLKIGNYEATEIADGQLQLRMPYAANVTNLRPIYKTNGAQVELKDADGLLTDASTLDLSAPVTLVLTSPEGRTKDYRVAVVYSNLPTVYLTTPTVIWSRDYWTRGCTMDIWNAGNMSRIYESVQVKGRGNTTWDYAKRPYAIKLDSKAEVLGMPAHKRWVLLANYLDVTCMRNAVAFEVARQLDGLAWTPRGEFVDVVMNGRLLGNYYLCEQIKIDKNRVNITEIQPADIDEPEVTGGYILEMDTNYDELFKFYTNYCNLPVQFNDPDEDIADQQYNYIVDYFNTIERLLFDGDPNSDDVFELIDINSFVDWWIVHEVVRNSEPNHPKSCFMYKDRGGKLMAGPVWDFDWATFTFTTSKFVIPNAVWYGGLLQNRTFVARVKERWAANMARLLQVEQFIDRTAQYILESAEGNKAMWPVSGSPNYDGSMTFTNAVNQLKANYRKRIEALSTAIDELQVSEAKNF